MYEKWGLPNVGGVNDQPYGILERSSMLLNLYRAALAYYNASDKVAFTKNNPAAWNAVAEIWRINGEPI